MKALCWVLKNRWTLALLQNLKRWLESVEHALLSSEQITGVNSREAPKAVGQNQCLLPCSAGLWTLCVCLAQEYMAFDMGAAVSGAKPAGVDGCILKASSLHGSFCTSRSTPQWAELSLWWQPLLPESLALSKNIRGRKQQCLLSCIMKRCGVYNILIISPRAPPSFINDSRTLLSACPSIFPPLSRGEDYENSSFGVLPGEVTLGIEIWLLLSHTIFSGASGSEYSSFISYVKNSLEILFPFS